MGTGTVLTPALTDPRYFPQWLGTGNVDDIPLKIQTSAYTREYQPAHLLSLCGNPRPPLPQTLQPQGAVIMSKTVQMPKKEKWAFILPEKMAVIEEKVQKGWDVAYVDGSKNEEGGVNFAGYGVWFGPGDTRNEQVPLPVHEKQTITRAELTAALRAIKNKCPGKPLLWCRIRNWCV